MYGSEFSRSKLENQNRKEIAVFLKTGRLQKWTIMVSDDVLKGQKVIADFMGISISTLKRHIHLIPIAKLGGCTIAIKAELLRWIKEHPMVLKNQAPFSRETLFPE